MNKQKRVNLPIVILCGLLFLSFAFFVTAKEDNATKNVFLDSDQDGISDSEERIFGTDPHVSDTDGDGYSDGAEIKSGYDPLKPAPGDKLMNDKGVGQVAGVETDSGDFEKGGDNLTLEMAQKISDLASGTNLEDGSVTVDDVQNMIESALEDQDIEEEIEMVSEDEINIKKQNYSSLSEKKKEEEMKEDFTDYAISLYYIFASNSPEPITSTSDLSSIFMDLSKEVILAIASRDPDSLEELEQNGEKILEQLKEVEVPEDVVDLHIKAISLAQYATSLRSDFKVDSEDPLSSIVGLSKIQGFLSVVSDFASEVEEKFLKYDLSYDEEIKGKIEDAGLIAPNEEDLPESFSILLGK